MGRNGELDLMGKSKKSAVCALNPWETKRRGGEREFEMKMCEREKKNETCETKK
jgi:hypothetical protein